MFRHAPQTTTEIQTLVLLLILVHFPPVCFNRQTERLQRLYPLSRVVFRLIPLSSRRPAIFPSSVIALSSPLPPNPCSFSSAILRDFHSIGVSRKYDAREILIREGFAADHFIIVCSGRVKATTGSSEGRLLLLRLYGPGEILGLSALRPHSLHCATVETLVPCTIKSIPRADFIRFMETHADVSRATALAFAREYSSALLTARRLALITSAAGKLASALLDLARADGVPAASNLPITFPMPLTHEELGNMVGLTRETVSRLLTRFRREGLVRLTQDCMTLPHPRNLEAICS